MLTLAFTTRSIFLCRPLALTTNSTVSSAYLIIDYFASVNNFSEYVLINRGESAHPYLSPLFRVKTVENSCSTRALDSDLHTDFRPFLLWIRV